MPLQGWDHASLHISADPNEDFRFMWNATGQTFFILRRRQVGDPVRYAWRISTASWITTTGWNSSTNTEVLVPGLNSISSPSTPFWNAWNPNDGNDYEYQVVVWDGSSHHSSWMRIDAIEPLVPVPVALNTGYVFFEGSRDEDDSPDFIGWMHQEDDDEGAHPLALTTNTADIPSLGYLNTLTNGYFYWLDKTQPSDSNPFNRIRRSSVNAPYTHTTVATPVSGVHGYLSLYILYDWMYSLEQYTGVSGTSDDKIQMCRYDLPALTNRQVLAEHVTTDFSGIHEFVVEPLDSVRDANITDHGTIMVISRNNNEYWYRKNGSSFSWWFTSNNTGPATNLTLQQGFNIAGDDTGKVERILSYKRIEGNSTLIRQYGWTGMSGSGQSPPYIEIRNETILNLSSTHVLRTGLTNPEFRFATSNDHIFVSRGTGPNIYRYDLDGTNQVVYETDDVNVQDIMTYAPHGWRDGDGEVNTGFIDLNELVVIYDSSDGVFYRKEEGTRIELEVNDSVGILEATSDGTYIYDMLDPTAGIPSTKINRRLITNVSSNTTLFNNPHGLFASIKRGVGRWSVNLFAAERLSNGDYNLTRYNLPNMDGRAVLSSGANNIHGNGLVAVTENNGFVTVHDGNPHQVIFYANLENPLSGLRQFHRAPGVIRDIGANGNDVYFIEHHPNAWYLKKMHEDDVNGHPITLIEFTSSDADWGKWANLSLMQVTPWYIFLSTWFLQSNHGNLWAVDLHGLNPTNWNEVPTNRPRDFLAVWPDNWDHDTIEDIEVPVPLWNTVNSQVATNHLLYLDWFFRPDEPLSSQVSYKIIRQQNANTDTEWHDGIRWRTGEPQEVVSISTGLNLGEDWDVANITRYYRVATKSSTGRWSHYSERLEITSLDRDDASGDAVDPFARFSVHVEPLHGDRAIRVRVVSGTHDMRMMDIDRRIVRDSQDDARALGVPENEVLDQHAVTRHHPVQSGAGEWDDLRVRSGVDYAYRVRVQISRTRLVDGEYIDELVWSYWSAFIG